MNNPKKKNRVLDYITNNLKLLLIVIILLLIFRQHVVMIITMAFLAYLGFFSIKASRVMPHISLETVTPSSILIGYVYGWQYGLAFGLIVGFTGFVKASLLNLTIIIVSLIMGLVGVLGALFSSMGMEFWLAYLLSYVIRALTSYSLMSVTGQSKVENIMHSFVESGYNMAIIIHFMNIIYNVITALG